MIGPILLAVTWLLLRFEHRSLRAIGFDAPAQRLRELAIAFLIAGATVVVQQFGLSVASGVMWTRNVALSPDLVATHLRFTVNSVLFEELIFRGYLLVQAMRWLGTRRAVWLSAAAFGVYHWFSFGAFGNPVLMVYLLLFTGAFGLMLATAFARTGSIAAPIGLHLGWNLAAYLLFSTGPLGAAVLVPANGAAKMHLTGLLNVLLSMGVPMLLVFGVIRALAYLRPVPAAVAETAR